MASIPLAHNVRVILHGDPPRQLSHDYRFARVTTARRDPVQRTPQRSMIGAAEGGDEMIQVVEGDIMLLDVDAIVNAANTTLLGGGGVDGAIHRAAGPGLLAECRALGGARTGEAKLTRGHRLKSRYVIHCVGPVWQGGDRGEPDLLASCYRNAFALAAAHHVKSIAFPAISTGIYGYPIHAATGIAVREARAFDKDHPDVRVIFCCFSKPDAATYRETLAVPVE
jgi:O-acetyl-ADP-ribose deacetylase